MNASGTTSEQAVPAKTEIKVTASQELAAAVEQELKMEDPSEEVAKAILAGKTNE